jgi:hypothetical protein
MRLVPYQLCSIQILLLPWQLMPSTSTLKTTRRHLKYYRLSLLSCSWGEVSADEGFLCDKAAVLGDRIKGTTCIPSGLTSFEVYASIFCYYIPWSTVFSKTLTLTGARGQSIACYGTWSFIKVNIKKKKTLPAEPGDQF